MNLLDFLYIPVAIVTAPAWAGKKREGWRERFGHTPPLPPRAAGKVGRVLVHGVSVGEVSALRTIVSLLLERGAEVVVSATTDTGIQRARELFGGTCAVVRYPIDFSRSVGRFLDAVRPNAVGLMELEVWPNFVKACTRRDIPVGVLSGRLSERSFKGYRKLRWALGPTFSRLAFVAAQEQDYADRFVHMGVPRERVSVAGSVKWDNAKVGEDEAPGAAQLAAELGIDRARPLIVAGSTGPTPDGGEEAMLHRMCPPGAQLLCAPRKPERFNEAAAALPGCVRRSQRPRGCAPTPTPAPGDRFLLDSIGELRQAYSLADLVVVGRSFGELFGSDPLEPVGLGKATLIGPAVADFQSVVGALEAAGGILRVDRDSLGPSLAFLLRDSGMRERVAARGRACIRGNQGASERNSSLLVQAVGGRSVGGREYG